MSSHGGALPDRARCRGFISMQEALRAVEKGFAALARG